MTNFIGEVSIKQLIDDLKKTSILLDVTIENETCYFDTGKVKEQKHCTHCIMIEKRDRIKEHINQLGKINRDTVYHVGYYDAYAMKLLLEDQSDIDKVEFEPLWQSNHDPDVDPPDSMIMRIYYSRYSLDPNGYHNGYENVIFKTICKSKSNLKLSGIPYNISPYVVSIDLSNYEIESTDCPPEDIPSFDSHPPECAVHSELPIDHDWDAEPYPDECTCDLNDEWNGYIPPDEDFWWQELDNVFNVALTYGNGIPDATYDHTANEWTIGDLNWTVGDPPTEIW